jgi:hypothetical protein
VNDSFADPPDRLQLNDSFADPPDRLQLNDSFADPPDRLQVSLAIGRILVPPDRTVGRPIRRLRRCRQQ